MEIGIDLALIKEFESSQSFTSDLISKIKLTSHNRALRDCGSTVNTTIYKKGYAQSKCVYSNDARW